MHLTLFTAVCYQTNLLSTAHSVDLRSNRMWPHPIRAQPELSRVHSSVVSRDAPGDSIWMNSLWNSLFP